MQLKSAKPGAQENTRSLHSETEVSRGEEATQRNTGSLSSANHEGRHVGFVLLSA